VKQLLKQEKKNKWAIKIKLFVHGELIGWLWFVFAMMSSE